MIDASVHRTVIEGRKLGDDISVGCVLILKQVLHLAPLVLKFSLVDDFGCYFFFPLNTYRLCVGV